MNLALVTVHFCLTREIVFLSKTFGTKDNTNYAGERGANDVLNFPSSSHFIFVWLMNEH